MAHNLLKAGYIITGCDTSGERLAQLVATAGRYVCLKIKHDL